MSGGHFGRSQHHITMVVEGIHDAIDENNIDYDYDQETIDKFKQAIITANKAYAMINRIDLLLSDDDSEETFHERWDEEINQGGGL